MAFGYEVHPSASKRTGAPTPFHHPPRPTVERSRTAPVSIPNNTSSLHEVPPPLPPPRNVEVDEHDLGWHMANHYGHRRPSEHSTPIRAGSSLLGGGQHARPGKTFTVPERSIDIGRRQALVASPTGHSPPTRPTNSLLSALKPGPKEEMVPASPPFLDLRRLMEYNKLQSEKPMSSDTLRRSSQAYDQQLLSKIGNSPAQQAGPTPLEESSMNVDNRLSRLNGQLLSLNRSATAPAPAPRFSGLTSPVSDSALEQYRLPSFSRRSSANNQLQPEFHHHDRFQSPGMAELSLQDRSPKAEYQTAKTGQKRRAQSPPIDQHNARVSSSTQHPEQWQRNVMHLAGDRSAHFQKFQSNQAPNSLSTVASSAAPGSYASSNFSVTQPSTAATSYSSDSFQGVAFQNTTAVSNQQAQGSMPTYHYSQLNTPSHSGHNMAPPPPPTSRKAGIGVLRAPGLWICDCCPKKPRKFDTEEELRIHEMEKQYICQYCHNRFKNKNEAERHQNSLHLRHHSWSCSALTSFEAAFHQTPINTLAPQIPGQQNNGNGSQEFQGLHSTATDTCGYCGQEFVNPPDWGERVTHLNQVHKFGECNQSKKFFRADHFRQHLKHSHAGTSGKWTNMLEQACMKDEPPPQPPGPGMPPVPNALPTGIPGIAMIGQQALLAQRQMAQARQAQSEQQHSPYQQFPGLQALQNYQPPPPAQQQFQPASTPTPQQQAQQAQSLAQHLQQAQREMTGMGGTSLAAPEMNADNTGQHGQGQP